MTSDSEDQQFYATLKFGDFTWQGYKIPKGREFDDIYIIHPFRIKTAINEKSHIDVTEVSPIKEMRFVFHHRLGYDHLLYEFEDES